MPLSSAVEFHIGRVLVSNPVSGNRGLFTRLLIRYYSTLGSNKSIKIVNATCKAPLIDTAPYAKGAPPLPLGLHGLLPIIF